jgi:hypothetical protein
MLRWMLLGTAMLVTCSAHAADLPRSVNPAYGPPSVYGSPILVEEQSDLLFTPLKGAFPEVHFPPSTPILLGSATLPGYYGSTHSYEYQGPYYGGPNINFRFRLPYACGVLGYC